MQITTEEYRSAHGVITLICLANDKGGTVVLSTLGAGITRVQLPSASGPRDVILGYANPADYMDDGPCAGKTPGRFANRIAKGHFNIDGRQFDLAINNEPNALHGGPRGFHNRLWDYELLADGVRFHRLSPDGEEGYPGTLATEVIYRWSDDFKLDITYRATPDTPTIVNLTNHAYFNLDNADNASVLDHSLLIRASRWLETDNTDIPTGRVLPVAGTPMDFTHGKPLGADINVAFSTLKIGKGYNHYFLLDDSDGKLRLAATLKAAQTGTMLKVYTTAPGLMLYTGNWLEGSPAGRNGLSYSDHSGVALECHAEPDAPNHPQFTNTVLRPGQQYHQQIVYEFIPSLD